MSKKRNEGGKRKRGRGVMKDGRWRVSLGTSRYLAEGGGMGTGKGPEEDRVGGKEEVRGEKVR